MDEYPNYTKLGYYNQRHRERFKRYVERFKLTCQECGGQGWFYDDYFPEFGDGPKSDCGWCYGTGLMTPKGRGLWLRYKREEAREKRQKLAKDLAQKAPAS